MMITKKENINHSMNSMNTTRTKEALPSISLHPSPSIDAAKTNQSTKHSKLPPNTLFLPYQIQPPPQPYQTSISNSINSIFIPCPPTLPFSSYTRVVW